MEELDALILKSGNVRLVAGSVEEGFATYLIRSRIMGFPDLISVKHRETIDGTEVAILSRSAYGGYDWGVNAGRVSAWIEALKQGEP